MKKLIRILLIALLIISMTVNLAFADEIFPGYPKRWYHRSYNGTLTEVTFKYYGTAVDNHFGIQGLSTSGITFWSAVKIGTTPVIKAEAAALGTAKYALLTATGSTWMYLMNNRQHDANYTYATTRLYDINGVSITPSNYMTTSEYINRADTYYPSSDYGDPLDGEINAFIALPTWKKISTVAHEAGHALGLGHTASTSIMMDGYFGYNITSFDSSCIIAKYFPNGVYSQEEVES